jgi:hypothetical protein
MLLLPESQDLPWESKMVCLKAQTRNQSNDNFQDQDLVGVTWWETSRSATGPEKAKVFLCRRRNGKFSRKCKTKKKKTDDLSGLS